MTEAVFPEGQVPHPLYMYQELGVAALLLETVAPTIGSMEELNFCLGDVTPVVTRALRGYGKGTGSDRAVLEYWEVAEDNASDTGIDRFSGVLTTQTSESEITGKLIMLSHQLQEPRGKNNGVVFARIPTNATNNKPRTPDDDSNAFLITKKPLNRREATPIVEPELATVLAIGLVRRLADSIKRQTLAA